MYSCDYDCRICLHVQLAITISAIFLDVFVLDLLNEIKKKSPSSNPIKIIFESFWDFKWTFFLLKFFFSQDSDINFKHLLISSHPIYVLCQYHAKPSNMQSINSCKQKLIKRRLLQKTKEAKYLTITFQHEKLKTLL